ncbi:hypothetical protein [Paenibacillus amylolyticus]|uniref:Transposase n=1 Tax=Paenibacillus amylolyticus TaxID=1451 RepID=A0ABD8AQY3_PAEAM
MLQARFRHQAQRVYPKEDANNMQARKRAGRKQAFPDLRRGMRSLHF